MVWKHIAYGAQEGEFTARYACASYGEEIGSELDDALKEEDKNEVELAIKGQSRKL